MTTRQRAWTNDALQLFGLRSNIATERVLASSIAVAERMDSNSFQPGAGDVCATNLWQRVNRKDDLDAGKPFRDYVAALEAFEKIQPPRDKDQAATLRGAANNCVQLGKKVKSDAARKKVAICQATLTQLEVYDLKDELVRLGNKRKPLDSADGQRAAAAGVKLDLLSLPPEQRSVAALGGDKGINATYWINKTGADGKSAKSFICKPMPKPNMSTPIPGLPDAGEAAREALVGRAGELLRNALQLDLDVPETHVVSLDAGFFPTGDGDRFRNTDSGVPVSVQEVRPNDGSVGRMSQADRAKVPKAKAHAIALMDIVTLNADRHFGNLLMSGTDPIPIDHGVSLCDPTTAIPEGTGPRRLAGAMASDHNVLLSLPSAHEPMDPATIQRIKGFLPSQVTSTLKSERDAMVQNQPAMQDKVTDAAIDAAGRATKFLALAARKAPTLSPAAIQVALGKNAETLLSPDLADNDFNQAATRILAAAAKDQDVLKAACLMNGAEAEALNAGLVELGWKGKDRYGAPTESIRSDPALALKIFALGARMDAPVNLDLDSEPAPTADRQGAILQEIMSNSRKLYSGLNQASKTWDPAAECKAHAVLMRMPPEQAGEPLPLGMAKFPVSPTTLLAEVRRLEEIRSRADANEVQAGGAAQAIRNKLIEIKRTAALSLVSLFPRSEQTRMRQLVGLAVRGQRDALEGLSAVSDNLFEELQTRLFEAADKLQDLDFKKGVSEAAAAGALKTAVEILAQAGQPLT